MKHYLNNLLCHCAPENGFAQDAIEAAIVSGNLHLTHRVEADAALIATQYDAIIRSYHHHLAQAA